MALPTPVTLTEPGAETGDLTRWTIDTAEAAVTASPDHGAGGTDAPRSGSYCFSLTGTNQPTGNAIYQDGGISAEATGAIDAGQAALEVSVWISRNGSQNDLTGFAVEFLDAGDASIARRLQ